MTMDEQKIRQISTELNECNFAYMQGHSEHIITNEALIEIIAELNVAVNFPETDN